MLALTTTDAVLVPAEKVLNGRERVQEAVELRVLEEQAAEVVRAVALATEILSALVKARVKEACPRVVPATTVLVLVSFAVQSPV